MLVLVIIAVLLAIATATFLNQQNKAHDTSTKSNLGNLARVANADYITSTVKRTNLILNPIPVGTTHWTSNQGTLSPGTGGAPTGHYLRVANPDDRQDPFATINGNINAFTNGMQAGHTYTLSAYERMDATALADKATAASINLPYTEVPTLWYKNADGKYKVVPAILPQMTANQWSADPVSITVTIPADATAAFFRMYGDMGARPGITGTGTVDYSGIKLEEAFNAGSYFPTTDQLSSGAADWTGTADGSVSTMTTNSHNSFSAQIAEQIARAEPEYTITSTGLYPTAPKTIDIQYINSNQVILRATSSDGTHYNYELDYADKKRRQLRFTGAETTSQTNLMLNPSFEADRNGWACGAPSGVTLKSCEITTSWSSSGGRSLHVKATNTGGTNQYILAVYSNNGSFIPVSGGATYSADARIHVNSTLSQGITMCIFWFTPTHDQIFKGTTATVSGTAPGEYTISLTQAVPAGAAYAQLKIGAGGGAGPNLTDPGSYDFDVDSVIFSKGSSPLPYFDGSYPDAAWDDPPNAPDNSTSSGYAWGSW